MMEIKVEYIATLEDYYAADSAFRNALQKGRVDVYVQIALALIALSFIAIGQYFLGGVIAVIAFMIQQGYVKRWIVRRNFNCIPNAGLTETLVFSSEHIIYECGTIAETIDWDSYAAYLESEDVFMLFYDSSDHYMMIPKRALTESDQSQLRNLLVEKLSAYEVHNV